MMCNVDIPYVVNTLKRITLNYNLFNAFSSTSYRDKSAVFEYLFMIFTKHSVNSIDRPELLKSCKSNFDESKYERFEYGIVKTSFKKKPTIIIVKLIGHPLLLKTFNGFASRM